jgi:hypothetical protein
MFKFLIKYYLPLNLLFDIFTSTLWESNTTTASIRGVILTVIIFIAWIKEPNNKIYTPFIFYTIYIILLLPFASDFLESLRLSSKVLFTLWAFPIFYIYNYLYTEKIVIRNILLLSTMLIVNYAISTIYGIGASQYTEGTEFLVGSLSDSWLIYTFTLFLYIIILKTKNIKTSVKIIYLMLFALLIVQLLLGLKRTAIIVFFFGIVIYLFLEKLNYKLIFTYIFGFIFVLFLLNQYSDILDTRLYARGDRLEGKYKDIIESEYRYLESIYVWEKTLSFDNFSESIFGLEAFNSRGNYGTNNLFGDRFLHIDYNIIVNTTGLVGLFFYFYIFYYIYQRYKERKIFLVYKYRELFLVIFLAQFIASIGGQMLSVTYGSIKFIFMAIALNKHK